MYLRRYLYYITVTICIRWGNCWLMSKVLASVFCLTSKQGGLNVEHLEKWTVEWKSRCQLLTKRQFGGIGNSIKCSIWNYSKTIYSSESIPFFSRNIQTWNALSNKTHNILTMYFLCSSFEIIANIITPPFRGVFCYIFPRKIKNGDWTFFVVLSISYRATNI